jgi:hypothetical protein
VPERPRRDKGFQATTTKRILVGRVEHLRIPSRWQSPNMTIRIFGLRFAIDTLDSRLT